MRIIAGEFRSRQILPPAGMETRPITDRVKLALFNILTPRLEGAVVADLFCGTGSMGLEALSRGSRHVSFAERDRSALQRLDQNIASLRVADRSTVWPGEILRNLPAWLAAFGQKFDIVFVDPPYAMAEAWTPDQAAREMFDPVAHSLAGGGVVVYRSPRGLALPERIGELTVARRKEYGTMALNFLELATGSP